MTKMPILNTTEPLFVSFTLLNEERARRNHSQSLETLAERGGLSCKEMVLCAKDLPLSEINNFDREYYTFEINDLITRSREL